MQRDLPVAGGGVRQRVSILIRPEGRMQPSFPTRISMLVPRFNPHPARRPDATGVISLRNGELMFQSSSGQKAGCNDR